MELNSFVACGAPHTVMPSWSAALRPASGSSTRVAHCIFFVKKKSEQREPAPNFIQIGLFFSFSFLQKLHKISQDVWHCLSALSTSALSA